MPVLEPLKSFFENMLGTPAPPENQTVAEARAAIHASLKTIFDAYIPAVAPLPFEEDHSVPVPGGSITVRFYSTASPGQQRPCLVYYHGGGFWLGSLDLFDPLCRAIAADTGCVVASVDYRLAPEHKFPTPVEDCYAALLWIAGHAAALGIDPARIAVGGGSAGGNLAAVVAMMARDRNGPPLSFQMLEIPVTDLTDVEPLRLPSEGLVVPSGKDGYRAHYLSDVSEANVPYASPLLAPDLTGLPPALIMCAEYDPLLAEGAAYARRLTEAGVAVEYRLWEGQFHGSQQMAGLIPVEAAAYHARIVTALRTAFGIENAPGGC